MFFVTANRSVWQSQQQPPGAYRASAEEYDPHADPHLVGSEEDHRNDTAASDQLDSTVARARSDGSMTQRSLSRATVDALGVSVQGSTSLHAEQHSGQSGNKSSGSAEAELSGEPGKSVSTTLASPSTIRLRLLSNWGIALDSGRDFAVALVHDYQMCVDSR